MKKALLVNLSGLGDVVSSLIVANSLERDYEVSYLISETFSGLFDGTVYSEFTTNKIPEYKFDLIVDLTSNAESRAIIKMTKGDLVIGRVKNFFQRVKFNFIYTSFVEKYPEMDNIIWDYLPILDRLNLIPNQQIFLGEIDKRKLDQVCIHIGADKEIRRIPKDLVIDLSNYLSSIGYTVRLIGTEHEIANDIIASTGSKVIYESSNLIKVKEWLSQSKFVIASDSGIFHLSAALGIPTLGVYGPNTYKRAGSINSNAKELSLDYDCRPCNQNQKCPHSNRCMKNITLDDILNKIHIVL